MPSLTAVLRPRCWSGKKRTRRPWLEAPLQHHAGVGGGADDAVVAAAVGLEAGRRVDVGDGDDIGDAGLFELVPAGVDVVGGGHVGHGAAGGHVGQHHDLVGAGEDVRRLGHEVHAAEDDVLLVALLGGPAGQLQRVAAVVGELDDVLALVVVAEDDQPRRRAWPWRRGCAPRAPERRGPSTRRGCPAARRRRPAPRPGGAVSRGRSVWHSMASVRRSPFADGETLRGLDLGDHDEQPFQGRHLVYDLHLPYAKGSTRWQWCQEDTK